jgi:hypothetical protein
MRLRTAALGLGAALAVAGSAEAAWYNANWAYRTQLTINGGLVPALQTNFPVLVAWTADAKLAAGAQASGNDILFTAADGTTKLDHEIESYTSATGALAAWVRIPALASPANTTIYMYYGNAGAASQQNRNGVWDASFRGVWHLVESPANGIAGHFDSTIDNFTGTPQGFADGTPGSTNAAGVVSGADRFLTDTWNVPAGNTVNRVEVPDNALLRPNGDMTVEAWINLVNPANGQFLVYKWDNGGGQFAYQLAIQNSAGSNYPAFQRLDSTGTIGPLVRGTTPLVAGTWYHVAGVRSGTTVYIYLNGNLEASSGGATGNIYATTPNFFVIGATFFGAGGLNGTEDEVRFSGSARSTTWLKTEYNNLTNQGVGAGKFLLSETQETQPTTRVYYSVGTSRSVPTDLKSGAPTITITGGVATFSVPQPANVGVGDEIVYGGVTSYISGRISSTQYTVTTRLGASAANVGATLVTRIYRAFASLATAVTNSSDASHLGTSDLVNGGIQLNLACYADGVMTMADAAEVDITGYTTGPVTYIRIYTPLSTREVGVSQRHTGVFGTGFQLNGSNADIIQIDDNYVRIEGLTILATVTNNLNSWGGIWSVPNGPSDVRITHNIIKGNVTDAAGRMSYGIGLGLSAADVSRVWDNIVYNFPVVTGSYGVGISLDYGTAYVFNNTVYDCDTGIQMLGTALAMQLKNNVSINDVFNPANFVDYSNVAAATRSNNVSSDATSETAALRNKTAYATYFRNTTAATEDLHITDTSLALWGSAGANLSADPIQPVIDDIDGAARVSPDIGADEFGLLEVGTGCPAGTAPSGTNFVQHGNLDKGKLSGGGGPAGNNFTTSATYNDWHCPGDTQATITIPPYPDACGGNGVAVTQFPGDPHYGVAAATNSLYVNGNNLWAGPPHGPYIAWRQTVTGLTANTTYTFFLYASNGNDGAHATPPILPALRFCKGVTGGGPYGCATTLNAVDFSIPDETVATGNVWTRYQVTFTTGAAETTADLAVLDAATDGNGDDLQVTQLGVQACAAPTAVGLMFFEAVRVPTGVELSWQTGSELSNLGFHLHRSTSAAGPWTRITTSIIPGLGSSPVGASYSYLDADVVPGQRYCYELEDIDTRSVSTLHGPVCTEPSPPGEDGGGGGGGDGSEREGPALSSCPSWVLSAAPDAVSPVCAPHGNPGSVSLQVVARDSSSATLELRTGGFWTLRDTAGTVRVFVPGLEFPSDSKAPALPLRRALVDAVVGKGVELVSAEASELQTFRGLRPSAVGARELVVHGDGTVRPARRPLAAPVLTRGDVPRDVARLAGTVFQGERKSAVVEITPVRFSGSGLVLARRVRVTLAFRGEVEGESGAGSRGRAVPRRGAPFLDVLARLYTSQRGLQAVTFEALFDSQRGFSTRLLRLQRQGEAVAFHVEPAGPQFGPGSVLYFYADRMAQSTDYSSEVAYELVRSGGKSQMSVGTGTPAGAGVGSSSVGFASFETNRIYQPGLLEAEDVWLWQAAMSTAAAPPPVAFSLSGVATSSEEAGRLVVHLQGGSESGVVADHHVRVLVNGVEIGEATFAGKKPYRLEAAVPASLLKEGANELSMVNVGDTGVYSLVFLDRFEVSYPQASLLRGGVFEGVWAEGGAVEVGGVTAPVVMLRDPGPGGGSEALSSVLRGERRASAVTGGIADSSGPVPYGVPRNDSAVRWITGFETTGSSVRFEAEAGHRYLVVSREGLLSPRIGRVVPSTLREASNQADYLVIAPRAFLEATTPLVERRRGQGLSSRAVAFEEIVSEFGNGQASGEAIKSFLSYAYHTWRRPSPRYVLLLGDATDDPRRFLSTSWLSPLPALFTKTSYLWTASDPALGAVNGADLLPDMAIGRLPATSREQAEALVSKVLAWEESGQGLAGTGVLVADTPDQGGDFEADVEDIRSAFLAGRATETLRVRELGAGTRPAILDAFDEGSSLMSYVGHGGTAVWSSSNVLSTWDAPSLLAQSRQPVLLTLNCLNGYFVAPNFDALPEALLKAEGRGVVAAVSPSGLSLDGPAHEYHRALMAELVSGGHERLGDAILAAQTTYAQTGLMPELLSVYHLLGDPAMRIR